MREGPVGSAWFAHFDAEGVVAHVDVRGPTYKGALTGGAKSMFCLHASGSPRPRLVLAEAAIDALSVAAIENLREDTLYGATGGGMGPGTIAALEARLGRIAMLPGALFCSATDANGAGDRFAAAASCARQTIRSHDLSGFGLRSTAATGTTSSMRAGSEGIGAVSALTLAAANINPVPENLGRSSSPLPGAA